MGIVEPIVLTQAMAIPLFRVKAAANGKCKAIDGLLDERILKGPLLVGLACQQAL